MYDLNRVTLLGRITRDPELRTTTSGKTVASMSVATKRTWSDASGAKQEKTEFTNCVLWGKLADIAGQYMVKGKRVYVEGRLETRDWTPPDGIKRYRTELIVENMIMLDGPRGGGSPGAPTNTSSEENLPTVQTDISPDKEQEIKVEDIPF